jgi:hypothetical protein
MTDEREDLVKVFVDLPNHWDCKGESMWARALGDDLYELENSPFCAYGLNYKDVVCAKAESSFEKPRILRIERRSGHRTLRFRFHAEVGRADRDRWLGELNQLGSSYEGDGYRFFTLDIPPGVDYQTICDKLFAWETDGVLEYETCEERAHQSFDDAPELETDADESVPRTP